MTADGHCLHSKHPICERVPKRQPITRSVRKSLASVMKVLSGCVTLPSWKWSQLLLMKLRISSSSKYFFLLCTPRLYRARWTTSTLTKEEDGELKAKISGRLLHTSTIAKGKLHPEPHKYIYTEIFARCLDIGAKVMVGAAHVMILWEVSTGLVCWIDKGTLILLVRLPGI